MEEKDRFTASFFNAPPNFDNVPTGEIIMFNNEVDEVNEDIRSFCDPKESISTFVAKTFRSPTRVKTTNLGVVCVKK